MDTIYIIDIIYIYYRYYIYIYYRYRYIIDIDIDRYISSKFQQYFGLICTN
jgi:hypothetical protein